MASRVIKAANEVTAAGKTLPKPEGKIKAVATVEMEAVQELRKEIKIRIRKAAVVTAK